MWKSRSYDCSGRPLLLGSTRNLIWNGRILRAGLPPLFLPRYLCTCACKLKEEKIYPMWLDPAEPGSHLVWHDFAASGSTTRTPWLLLPKPEKTRAHLFFSSFHSIVVAPSTLPILTCCRVLSISWIIVVPFGECPPFYSVFCLEKDSCLGLDTANLYLDHNINKSCQPLQPSRNRHDPTIKAVGWFIRLCEDIWPQLPYCAPSHESSTGSPTVHQSLAGKQIAWAESYRRAWLSNQRQFLQPGRPYHDPSIG